MKKYFLILIVWLFTIHMNGQELFIGGGGICTLESSYPSGYDTRFGIDGTFEIKPFTLGLIASISPNVLFDDEGTLYTLPFELKWLIGNKFKIYPSIGYVIRNRSFTGVSTGLGVEVELNEKLKAGLKCNRIAGKYNPEPSNLSATGEISIQVGLYMMRSLK